MIDISVVNSRLMKNATSGMSNPSKKAPQPGDPGDRRKESASTTTTATAAIQNGPAAAQALRARKTSVEVVEREDNQTEPKRDRDDRTANAQEHTPSISTRH